MERQPKFKIGDVVRHIIDDRVVKIEVVNHNLLVTGNYSRRVFEFKGMYHCSWTDSSGERQEGDIAEELLVHGT